jgi:hypothetical protein
MENVIKLLKEINEDLMKNNQTLKLEILENEINTLLSKIKTCNTIEQAHYYFDVLEKIQSEVAGWIFINEIDVTDCLWKFFKDFDRIDDKEVKLYLFDQIKKGTYSLSQGGFLWYR